MRLAAELGQHRLDISIQASVADLGQFCASFTACIRPSSAQIRPHFFTVIVDLSLTMPYVILIEVPDRATNPLR